MGKINSLVIFGLCFAVTTFAETSYKGEKDRLFVGRAKTGLGDKIKATKKGLEACENYVKKAINSADLKCVPAQTLEVRADGELWVTGGYVKTLFGKYARNCISQTETAVCEIYTRDISAPNF